MSINLIVDIISRCNDRGSGRAERVCVCVCVKRSFARSKKERYNSRNLITRSFLDGYGMLRFARAIDERVDGFGPAIDVYAEHD